MKTAKFLSLLMSILLLVTLFAGCSGNDGSPPSDTSPPVVADTSTPAARDADDGGDGYEEGTSPTDGIVNTTASAEKVLLVVSFGTSFNQSRHLTIGGIETALKDAYPDYQVRRAFTSQIIMNKLAARDGLKIDNVEEALNRMVLDKVKEVVIQPTTVMNGYEYEKMLEYAMPFADKFESFKIGKWLLADDIDYEQVAEIMAKETAAFRADGTAIVWMGHGTEHEANDTYMKLQNVLHGKGYTDHLIGTVEGGPEIEDIQESLKEMGVKKAVLRPLMIVAGDHANNDMADEEDEESWYSILTQDGYAVENVIEGLGQIKEIQALFVRHVQDAINSTDLSVTPTASAVGVTADRIKNGVYSLDVTTDSSMFRIVDCQLTVEDNSMTAVITLSGKGYAKVYMGSVEQAITDTEDNGYTEVDERRAFTVPVEALDRSLPCAGLGERSGTWYDHTAVFKSANIPGDAFLPCQIDAAMKGGSGKASIQSPANLYYRDGANIAEIVWSSPNYIYMIVDKEKYLPINTEGNSTFEIPVKPDTDMKIIACTAAMSEPKEIEYTLRFDSSSIK